jgi:hypothetical protein
LGVKAGRPGSAAFWRTYDFVLDLVLRSPSATAQKHGPNRIPLCSLRMCHWEGSEEKIRCHLICVGPCYGVHPIRVSRITVITAIGFVGRAETDLSADTHTCRSTRRVISERIGRRGRNRNHPS